MNNIIDDEWQQYITNNNIDTSCNDNNDNNENIPYPKFSEGILDSKSHDINAPEASEIYISTKSKIAYLTEPVDLKIFWDIPVISYSSPTNGVIKKQIKINSNSIEELNNIQEKLTKELYYEETIMTSINNPTGRIKFKDIRKISIGISKKDIMTYRSKKKQAFYNCFVMIIRIKNEDVFKEFHIKVFNTGKLEIPGVQNDTIFEIILTRIIETLQPFSNTTLSYKKTSDTVLINSNFNCGFYINREVLYDILKYKYHIQAIYDPCSYPGIQCKFYYNRDSSEQSGRQITLEHKEKYKNITEVSFMIFRTGSVLIVGMCNDDVLLEIYEFLKTLLKTEFKLIFQKLITNEIVSNKNKKRKIRKKIINISNENEHNYSEDLSIFS